MALGLADGDEVGALERVDRDVDLGRSARGPAPPTCSPMNSIGASSRSPSPMTIGPAKSMSSNVLRIASVASRSAAIRSPRPIRAPTRSPPLR